jgi:uncharacterized protein YyaL (SSP411 family)
VRDHLWDADAGRLRRRYADGVVEIDGYLEDYAFLGRGALDCFEATGDVDHLAFALDLGREIEARFWDADESTLYFTAVGGEQLVARPQEVTDQSTPSSLGVAVDLLARLDRFVDHDRFGDVVESALSTQSARIESNPLQHVSLALAADRWIEGDLELTLVADEPPAEWTETLRNRYLPRRLLAWRPRVLEPWLDRLDLAEPPAIWAGRDGRNGEPTVYACRSFTCSPPQHQLEGALDWAATELDAPVDNLDEDAPF